MHDKIVVPFPPAAGGDADAVTAEGEGRLSELAADETVHVNATLVDRHRWRRRGARLSFRLLRRRCTSSRSGLEAVDSWSAAI